MDCTYVADKWNWICMTQENCIRTVLELVRIVWHKVIGNFHFCKHFNGSHKQYNADHMHTHR